MIDEYTYYQVIAERDTALAEVKKLEEFVKYDYISMKNWQEEKATLQAKVEKLTSALELASLHFNRSTKYGQGWQDALAYIKQATLKKDTGIQDMMAEVESLSQEGE